MVHPRIISIMKARISSEAEMASTTGSATQMSSDEKSATSIDSENVASRDAAGVGETSSLSHELHRSPFEPAPAGSMLYQGETLVAQGATGTTQHGSAINTDGEDVEEFGHVDERILYDGRIYFWEGSTARQLHGIDPDAVAEDIADLDTTLYGGETSIFTGASGTTVHGTFLDTEDEEDAGRHDPFPSHFRASNEGYSDRYYELNYMMQLPRYRAHHDAPLAINSSNPFNDDEEEEVGGGSSLGTRPRQRSYSSPPTVR